MFYSIMQKGFIILMKPLNSSVNRMDNFIYFFVFFRLNQTQSGQLINKPSGCGEQNMLGLTPNIYALKYLHAQSNKYSNVKLMIANARHNIQLGYQNELNYMHDDGSFSAFGKSDSNGSSWLTAFVIKSFSQAKQYVETIDENVIKKSIDWLISNQNEDGSFNEPGSVIHKDMQGGVNSRLTVTSYILISLLESNIFDLLNQRIWNSIAMSTRYLEKNMNSVENNTYALSLVTYALNLGSV